MQILIACQIIVVQHQRHQFLSIYKFVCGFMGIIFADKPLVLIKIVFLKLNFVIKTYFFHFNHKLVLNCTISRCSKFDVPPVQIHFRLGFSSIHIHVNRNFPDKPSIVHWNFTYKPSIFISFFAFLRDPQRRTLRVLHWMLDNLGTSLASGKGSCWNVGHDQWFAII